MIKGVAAILVVCALLAAVADSLHQAIIKRQALARANAERKAEDDQVVEEFRRLQQSPTQNPERLAEWVRSMVGPWSEADENQRPAFNAELLMLGNEALEPVIRKHASAGPVYDVFVNYVRCRFAPKDAEFQSWREALEQATKSDPPVRFAGEFLGDLLLMEDKPEQALTSYLMDADMADGAHARKMALDLAMIENNLVALRHLMQDDRNLVGLHPTSLIRISRLLDDKRLVLHAIYGIQTERWQHHVALPIALLTAAVWYVILVHTASRERWRWLRYLIPVALGLVSVLLLHWFQITLDYPQHPEMEENPTQQMIRWIMYVGVPEEACKLIMFSFFLPVLLHVKSARKAALTAGAVGLGFALNENLHYFLGLGMKVALERLVTANFIHISLTGIAGYYLYQLFRSRFHRAVEFLVAFAGVSVAHGLYNFALGSFGHRWEINIASLIIVAAAAKVYFQVLHSDAGEPSSSRTMAVQGIPISRTCVFWFGGALLTGLLMIASVWETQDLGSMADTLKGAVILVPVAFIFMREFDELNG